MFTLRLLSMVVLMGLILSCLTTSTRSSEPSFSVSSFIPERFADFRWQIGGDIRLSGSRLDSRDEYYLQSTRTLDESRSTDRQSFNLGTDIAYRFETIPRFLTLTTSFTTGFDHWNSLSSANVSDSGIVSYAAFSDNDAKTSIFDIDQGFDFGQYLVGDAFVSVAGNLGAACIVSSYNQSGTGSDSYPYYSSDTVIVEFRDIQSDNPRNRNLYSLGAKIMPGWGRVYEGQYAATALYMINELKHEGVLRQTPTADEMRELTEIIYQYRLQHAVDQRLHKIKALSLIMEYLETRGMVDPTGRHGYLQIADVWDYFPFYYRRFGYRLRGGAGIEYSFERNSQSRDEDILTITALYDRNNPNVMDTIAEDIQDRLRYQYEQDELCQSYLSFTSEYHRPVNLRWQIDLIGDFRYYYNAYGGEINHSIVYMNNGDEIIDEHFGDTRIEYNAFHSVNLQGTMQYIFDSRTSAEAGVTYYHEHYNSSRRENVFDRPGGGESIGLPYRNDVSIGSLILRTTINYRISIPTSLGVVLEYRTIEQEVLRQSLSLDDTDSYYLRVSVSHYLY